MGAIFAALTVQYRDFRYVIPFGIQLWIDGLELKPKYDDAMSYTLPMYFVIGVAQCEPAWRYRLLAMGDRSRRPSSQRNMNFLAFTVELLHMRPIGAWAGASGFSLPWNWLRLFSPSDIFGSGERAPLG